MRHFFLPAIILLLLIADPLLAQNTRLWVLRGAGEIVEYDPATFAVKQKVAVPAEAVKSAANLSVNHLGQILFALAISLPLSERIASIWCHPSFPIVAARLEHVKRPVRCSWFGRLIAELGASF
jgi:hypothetical protein